MRTTDENLWRGAGLALALLLLSVVPTHTYAADATTLGRLRTLGFDMPINPIHVALLKNGKVLIVAGSESDPTAVSNRAALWNRGSNAITVQTLPRDLFCNGMSFLPDGRVLIAGGTKQYDPFYGEAYGTLYNPATNTFTEGPNMAGGRWYPTNTVLGDGRTIVIGGLGSAGASNNTYEVFNPTTLSWSVPYVSPFLSLYPWGHLISGGPRAGMVVYVGRQQATQLLNPATNAWSVLASTNYAGGRSYGSSVLLPLTPQDGYTSQVLIMGGHSPATNTVERINLSDPQPHWVTVRPMAKARIELNATLLPNGQVLVTGGSAINEDASTAARAAELYDPATNTWSTLAAAAFPRLYHSVALLLPTGEVWTAGSNPARGVWQKKMEIYKPPYFFTKNAAGTVTNAPRPAITSNPASVAFNAPFTVGVTSPSGVRSVVLMRTGAVTHARDMEQRLIQLPLNAVSATSVRVTSPPNGNVAPKGYYLLYVNDTKGVPSVGKFIHLG